MAAVGFAVAAVALGLFSDSGGSGDGGTATSAPAAVSASGPPKSKDQGASESRLPPADGRYRKPVPILMYHEIGSPAPGAAYPELFVSTSDFKAQLKWLDHEGYEAVTLDELYDAWKGKVGMPEKPVVISFDDGLLGQYLHALPKLSKRGWPGVLNLKLVAIASGDLTKKMIREMIDAGWEVDSHTITHADVSAISGAALQDEVAGSRQKLQKLFDIPVNFFCYPAGRYDDEAIAAVKDAGYLGATTTEEGFASPSDDPYTLPRVRVDGSDGVDGLAEKLG